MLKGLIFLCQLEGLEIGSLKVQPDRGFTSVNAL
jgi:hypothetical protein